MNYYSCLECSVVSLAPSSELLLCVTCLEELVGYCLVHLYSTKHFIGWKCTQTVSTLSVGTGAQSPCPGLTHPLWFPGHWRRFWTGWMLKLTFSHGKALSSPIPARENWRMKIPQWWAHLTQQLSLCWQPIIVLIFEICLSVCWARWRCVTYFFLIT